MNQFPGRINYKAKYELLISWKKVLLCIIPFRKFNGSYLKSTCSCWIIWIEQLLMTCLKFITRTGLDEIQCRLKIISLVSWVQYGSKNFSGNVGLQKDVSPLLQEFFSIDYSDLTRDDIAYYRCFNSKTLPIYEFFLEFFFLIFKSKICPNALRRGSLKVRDWLSVNWLFFLAVLHLMQCHIYASPAYLG